MNKKGFDWIWVIMLFMVIIGIILLIFVASDWNYDNSCKSIGYDKVVRIGFQQYSCVKTEGAITKSIRVGFRNCGFEICEIYKLGDETNG